MRRERPQSKKLNRHFRPDAAIRAAAKRTVAPSVN